MVVASPWTISTIIIIIKIGTQIDEDIVLDVASPRTTATVKRSMNVRIILVTSMKIDKVTFVEIAAILQNIAAVKAME